MRNQRLVGRQFQVKLVLEEVGQLLLDPFSLVTGPDETEQKIVRIPDVLETPILWIVEHARRKALGLLSQCARFLRALRSSQISSAVKNAPIDGIRFAIFTTVVRREEHRLDERVQPVKVNIGEDGTHDAPLRRA